MSLSVQSSTSLLSDFVGSERADQYVEAMSEMHIRLIHAEAIMEAIGKDQDNIAFARFQIEAAVLQLRYSCELLIIALGALARCNVKTGSLADIRKAMGSIKLNGLSNFPICIAAVWPLSSDVIIPASITSSLGIVGDKVRFIYFTAHEYFADLNKLEELHKRCGDALHIGGIKSFVSGYSPKLLDVDELDACLKSLTSVAQGHFVKVENDDRVMVFSKPPGTEYDVKVIGNDEALVINGKAVTSESVARDVLNMLRKSNA